MDDPEVERQLREVDRLADRVAVGVGDLVDRVAVRPGLHLHHRERLAVVEVEVGAVLQERALHRDRALVVEPAAEAQVRRDVVHAERVVEPVGRARVLVVDDGREHHVAHVGVQRRRLAEHVDAAQRRAVHRHLAQDVVGGQAERVVDVHDHALGRRQRLGVHVAEPRVDRSGRQPRQRDDLRGHPQRRRAADVRHAALRLRAPPRLAALLAVRVEVEPRHEVEEVLPRALGAALAEAPRAPSRRMSSSGSCSSTNSTSTCSRSRATPVAMFTRLCVFELTK